MKRLVWIAAALSLSLSAAGAQDPGRPRVNREQMWPAATEEGWKKPVRITFQRTWEDALALQKETGQAILICINMDGEIASEHYAGVRYRDPEIAKLYEPYICVVASTYRHTPKDYDEKGGRILCPRFGSVTCGEHISIEPILFEKYMDGQRIAPRHIMIEVDGGETYDVYYANDTASIFEAIRKGIAERTVEPKTIVRGDRSIVERVSSPDIRDRQAVEGAYAEGDRKAREAILAAAADMGKDAPIDVLRLAVHGLDLEMSKTARDVLTASESAQAVNLINEALAVPMPQSDREQLIAALERLGRTSARARWLAAVHEGLTATPGDLDVDAWSKGGGEYKAPPMASPLAKLESDRTSKADAVRQKPKDATAYLDLAEASLALAMRARRNESDPIMAKVVARHMFEDARIHAEEAGNLKGPAWRVNTVLALVAYYRGDSQRAYELSADAVREIPPGEPSWNTMAILTVFAEGRFQSIKKEAKANRRWPGRWLRDLDDAYTTLLHHPLGTDDQALWYYEFLDDWLGAKFRAIRFLRSALAQFPESSGLHERLRRHVLANEGVEGLERTYEELLETTPTKNLPWFAGYASLIAAEYHRRARHVDDAAAAYGRSLGHFDRAAKGGEAAKHSSDHYASLAIAGLARLAYERGDDAEAVARIVASFERRPTSAGTLDGMGITPAETAWMIRSRLEENGEGDLAASLKAAMDKLDPALLVSNEK